MLLREHAVRTLLPRVATVLFGQLLSGDDSLHREMILSPGEMMTPSRSQSGFSLCDAFVVTHPLIKSFAARGQLHGQTVAGSQGYSPFVLAIATHPFVVPATAKSEVDPVTRESLISFAPACHMEDLALCDLANARPPLVALASPGPSCPHSSRGFANLSLPRFALALLHLFWLMSMHRLLCSSTTSPLHAKETWLRALTVCPVTNMCVLSTVSPPGIHLSLRLVYTSQWP